MEEETLTFEEREKRFRERAKGKYTPKQINAFIDSKAEEELVRRGDVDVSEITDPSTQLKLRTEGIESKAEPTFPKDEAFVRTEVYLDEIVNYETKEEALGDLEKFLPTMEVEIGKDNVELVRGAIERHFVDEEQQDAGSEWITDLFKKKPEIQGAMSGALSGTREKNNIQGSVSGALSGAGRNIADFFRGGK